ncbi:hypothetical protein RF11_01810 [Thelohanellus kitauei]|uniref:Uncharacterized protein n=1 Tax=Thelohanellus kitauei TaxID=669202 RepID=A0A0C2N3D4_THEKT|nr:hypothetical protein RF11_01810 [Thelohanellus kitauei]
MFERQNLEPKARVYLMLYMIRSHDSNDVIKHRKTESHGVWMIKKIVFEKKKLDIVLGRRRIYAHHSHARNTLGIKSIIKAPLILKNDLIKINRITLNVKPCLLDISNSFLNKIKSIVLN